MCVLADVEWGPCQSCAAVIAGAELGMLWGGIYGVDTVPIFVLSFLEQLA